MVICIYIVNPEVPSLRLSEEGFTVLKFAVEYVRISCAVRIVNLLVFAQEVEFLSEVQGRICTPEIIGNDNTDTYCVRFIEVVVECTYS